MPYKYVKENAKPGTEVPSEPKITETKEISKPQPLTEEEAQMETVKEHHDKFFDEDDEILEVNWE